MVAVIQLVPMLQLESMRVAKVSLIDCKDAKAKEGDGNVAPRYLCMLVLITEVGMPPWINGLMH
jgi:hypothetical protein